MQRLTLAVALALALAPRASTQISGGGQERGVAGQARINSQDALEPVAETRILMLGINLPNFQGLQQRLARQPANKDSWEIVRGEALLIAENGNLLILRDPPAGSRQTWVDRARDLRSAGKRLARAAADRDYARSRDCLADLLNSCNRCHRNYGVRVDLSGQGNSRLPAVPQPPQPPPVPGVLQPPQPAQPTRPPGDRP